MSAAVLLVIAVDLAFLAVAAVIVASVWRAYGSKRRHLPDPWLAMEEVVAHRIGYVPARLVIGEPKTLWALVIVVLRRRHRQEGAFPYASRSQIGMVIGVVLGLVVLEGGLGGLLIPIPWLKLTLLLVSTYAALWILGIYFSLRAYPHIVTGRGIVIRYGVLADAWIPWEQVSELSLNRSTSPGGQDGLVNRGGTAIFSVGGKTDIVVRLKSAGAVNGFLRRRTGVETIELSADEPNAMVGAAQSALEQFRGARSKE
jgi:hypothetical protein